MQASQMIAQLRKKANALCDAVGDSRSFETEKSEFAAEVAALEAELNRHMKAELETEVVELKQKVKTAELLEENLKKELKEARKRIAEMENRLVESQVENILPDDTLQWMWGDKNALATLNPLRWSSFNLLGAIVKDLEKHSGEQRPVKMRRQKDMATFFEFDTVDLALHALRQQALDWMKEFNVNRDEHHAVWVSAELAADPNPGKPCLEIIKQGRHAEVLGKGGFGIVVKAKILPHGHQQFVQQVAAKGDINILNTEMCKQISLADFQMLCARLEREIRALRSLKHRFLIRINGIAWEDIEHSGHKVHVPVWILMELPPDAHRFRDFIQILSSEDVERYSMQLLQVMAYIHSKGFVHCDLRPENVLILIEPKILKVIDLGTAQLTQESTLTKQIGGVGGLSGNYMCPEGACTPENASRDMFAFGTMLFEMMTRESAPGCRKSHPEGHLPLFGTRKLHDVALQCINEQADKRPGAAAALKQLGWDTL